MVIFIYNMKHKITFLLFVYFHVMYRLSCLFRCRNAAYKKGVWGGAG